MKLLAPMLLSALIATACSKGGSDDTNPPTGVKTPTYQFTITNWDDGWTSTIKENWAEVNKGTVKVLLHYPNAATEISADPQPLVNNARNLLSASRYSNLQNFTVASPSLDFERAYLGYGAATDIATSKTVFVALFKKGKSGWIEFVTPDKATFVAQFGLDPVTIDWSTSGSVFNSLRVMANYNRFAVAATDLESTGKWTNNFGANTFYYSLYTGLGVGMSSYSATEEFIFSSKMKYQWQLFTANSAGGGTTFAKARSAGNYQLKDNWNAYFSDIEGVPKTYPVWFAATKTGRVLFIDGNPYTWVGQ
ncbi:hypothetical protein MKQ70_24275 [Chitinophaga sedimenti]|uniref:hypothetical protein n=1 Tax=Chitinophaga sedimenti TaxID=2033606 RepID=UPI0020055B63|nr:hypothetical protein [Chitinophaga sedimenti]MCK7557956.1 hypothetical protein [Chitinophaga sedimenti]